MNFLRVKLLTSSLCLLLFFFLFPHTVSAQTTAVTPLSEPVDTKNLSTLTQEVAIHVLGSVSCQLTGINPADKNRGCLGIDPKTQQMGYIQNGGGMVGFMGKMIAVTYTPPLHTADFIAYTSHNFGLVKSANAAPTGKVACDPAKSGTGYCGLTPLMNIWKAFRDLAFFVFTFVFTLIGLGVMLRIKIDPRSVMTLENQIPRVIIALVLISFSFAIAGLLIDIMYTAIYVVFSFFANPSLYPEGNAYSKPMIESFAEAQKNFQGSSPFAVLNQILGKWGILNLLTSASGGAGDFVQSIFYQKPDTTSVSSFLTTGGWLAVIQNVLGYLLSWIASIAVFIVFAIALLVALFRVWFALLYAYIHILIDVILAPVWIMAGIMPGSSMTFESWVRDLLANTMAFPTVVAMFLLGRFFLFAFVEQADPVFTAPLIGSPIRSGDLAPLGSLIAVGVIFMTPSAVKMMQELFKSPSFKWSATAFQQVGAGAGVPGKIGGGVLNYGFGTHYDEHGAHGGRWGSGAMGAALKAMNVVH